MKSKERLVYIHSLLLAMTSGSVACREPVSERRSHVEYSKHASDSEQRLIDAGATFYTATFRASNGMYVAAENQGGGEINANRTSAQAWETFKLVDNNGGLLQNGDLVYIQTDLGYFFQVTNGTSTSMNVSGKNPGTWEAFKVITNGSPTVTSGNVIGFQSITNNRLISAVNGGGGTVNVAGAALDTWEKFTVSLTLTGTTTPLPPVTTPLPPVTTPLPPVTTPLPPVTTPLPPVTTPAPTGILKGFVHTSGTKLLDGQGNSIHLNGINLGNWLVWEGYLMMGDYNYRTHSQFFASLSTVLGSSAKAAEFEHQWRMNYVDEKTIMELKGLGFNALRAPFNYKLFWADNKLSDKGFLYLDRLINLCRAQGMYVLLDMHGGPGYQNPGDHSDNNDSNQSQPRSSVKFWDGDNVKIASQVWASIAAHYKDEPVVFGYDLINEPVPQDGREYELLPSLIAMAHAIRAVDNNHTIVAEASWWASDLSKIDWNDSAVQSKTSVKAKWDTNLVYEIHHYGPLSATMGRENITNALNIPLILGEYGETDDANMKATTAWAKQNLAGSFPWSFKKMSHGKTLWTIPSNASYEQMKSFINSRGLAPMALYDSMLDFAQNNIRNGHSSLQWSQSWYDDVKP